MILLEFKTYAKPEQLKAVDEAIGICQFIRNKSIRLGLDGDVKSGFALSKYCAIWAKEFDFGDKLGKGTTSQCRKSMGFALALL
jgi:putative transposase